MATKEPGNRKRTGNKTSFKPGQSGNPSGRPKRTAEEIDILEKMKGLAPDAVEVLGEILNNEDIAPSYRLKAAEIILDRVVCKAEAMMRLDVNKDSEITVNLVGVEDLSK